MIPGTTIVVVDDDERALTAIADCLKGLSAACLPVLVKGAKASLSAPLSGLRLIFFDIRYIATIEEGAALYDSAAAVLRQVVQSENGPYVLITWSTHTAEHEAFLKHLSDHYPEIPAPVISAPLPKEKFIAAAKAGRRQRKGSAYNYQALSDEIKQITSNPPEVAALLAWETSTYSAARAVVDALCGLIPREERFGGKAGPPLHRLLLKIAQEAVGKENVVKDRRSSVNDGLGPILIDRLLHGTVPLALEEAAAWKIAFPNTEEKITLKSDEQARLNSLTNFSFSDKRTAKAGDRGVACALPKLSARTLKQKFGQDLTVSVKEYIVAKKPNSDPPPNWDSVLASCNWVLIGVRALCDQVQSKGSGIARVVLALEVPSPLPDGFAFREHGAAYRSPIFAYENSRRLLVFNWHFLITMTERELRTAEVKYRIRESLIDQITTSLSGHATRPGIINFTS